MAKVLSGRQLGARINRQKRKLVLRTMRRSIVADCLRAGVMGVESIRSVIAERDASLPRSRASVYRDKWYWQERWEREAHCPACGSRLAILSSDVPTEL